jgi:hypothetical protein
MSLKTAPSNKSEVFKKLAQKYSTPKKVQEYLKTVSYNREEKGETCFSALTALKMKKLHCLEASVLAAAILEHRGYPPTLLFIDSVDHLCHALFIFKEKTGWGAIGRSREPGLHGRAPRFRSIRDLALSYCDPFVDKTGRVVGFAPLNLDESGTDWRYSKKHLWKLERFVVNTKYEQLRSSEARFQKLFRRYETQGSLLEGKHWW